MNKLLSLFILVPLLINLHGFRIIRSVQESIIETENKNIYITYNTIMHIREKHPEVVDQDIVIALQEPDLILREMKYEETRLYLRKIGQKVLKVVIKYERRYTEKFGKVKGWFLKSAYFLNQDHDLCILLRNKKDIN